LEREGAVDEESLTGEEGVGKDGGEVERGEEDVGGDGGGGLCDACCGRGAIIMKKLIMWYEPPFSGASLPDGLELGLGVSDQIAAGNIQPGSAL